MSRPFDFFEPSTEPKTKVEISQANPSDSSHQQDLQHDHSRNAGHKDYPGYPNEPVGCSGQQGAPHGGNHHAAPTSGKSGTQGYPGSVYTPSESKPPSVHQAGGSGNQQPHKGASSQDLAKAQQPTPKTSPFGAVPTAPPSSQHHHHAPNPYSAPQQQKVPSGYPPGYAPPQQAQQHHHHQLAAPAPSHGQKQSPNNNNGQPIPPPSSQQRKSPHSGSSGNLAPPLPPSSQQRQPSQSQSQQQRPNSPSSHPLAPSSAHQLAPNKSSSPIVFPKGPSMEISLHDRQQLLNAGYCIVNDVVPSNLRFKAVQAINRSLGKIPITARHTTSTPELISNESILNLFHCSGVQSIVGKILGDDYHLPPFAFINLQYPGDGCVDEEHQAAKPSNDQDGWQMLGEPSHKAPTLVPLPNWKSHWKIDGLPAPSSGPNDQNHIIRNYSLLVGIVLADNVSVDCGNFVVWPGSHLAIQGILRNGGGTSSMLNAGKLDRPVIDQIQLESIPMQLSVKAGDVILCHYQTAHAHAPNLGCDIKSVVFFRVYAKAHNPNSFRPMVMDNIFYDYSGLYDLIGVSHPE